MNNTSVSRAKFTAKWPGLKDNSESDIFASKTC